MLYNVYLPRICYPTLHMQYLLTSSPEHRLTSLLEHVLTSLSEHMLTSLLSMC